MSNQHVPCVQCGEMLDAVNIPKLTTGEFVILSLNCDNCDASFVVVMDWTQFVKLRRL